MVADVLLFTLRHCCGEKFTCEAQVGWEKILSRILDIVVPITSHFEMQNHAYIEQERGVRYQENTLILSSHPMNALDEDDEE